MDKVRARVWSLSLLVIGSLAVSTLAISTDASAAGVSGTWGSRIPGEGYMQTYIGPYGSVVTDYFDVELQLTESGGTVSGTLRAWNGASDQVYEVWGTVSGSTFYMTADYGWDGVNFLTPTYNLAIDGDTMFGSGSYVNVGVTITGTFDIEKEGFFAVGGLAPVVSGVSIALAIVAIVVASSAGASSAGARPGVAGSSGAGRPVPSQQWETGPGLQHGPLEQGTPLGGVGLHYPAPGPPERPLTEPERKALKAVTRSPRANAIGLAVMSAVMAILVNFVEEPVALVMPLFFGAVSLGTAFQARKVATSVGRALDRGTAADVRAVPSYRSGSWDLGAFQLSRDSSLRGVLVDGSPATVAVVPEARRVLGVNGVPLRKALELRPAPGFPQGLVPAVAPASAGAVVHGTEDLPPPPEDLEQRACPQCGHPLSGDVKFCETCGTRLRP